MVKRAKSTRGGAVRLGTFSRDRHGAPWWSLGMRSASTIETTIWTSPSNRSSPPHVGLVVKRLEGDRLRGKAREVREWSYTIGVAVAPRSIEVWTESPERNDSGKVETTMRQWDFGTGPAELGSITEGDIIEHALNEYMAYMRSIRQ